MAIPTEKWFHAKPGWFPFTPNLFHAAKETAWATRQTQEAIKRVGEDTRDNNTWRTQRVRRRCTVNQDGKRRQVARRSGWRKN